ncbi:MAG: diguanylate cyclase [Betaproteobacteria bacterium]|nr:diguanylate cyclase [Betaproteobacteria bacterium]
MGLSMGLALHPGHGDDPATLLRRADAAMYESKARKQQRLRWWQLAQQPLSTKAG